MREHEVLQSHPIVSDLIKLKKNIDKSRETTTQFILNCVKAYMDNGSGSVFEDLNEHDQIKEEHIESAAEQALDDEQKRSVGYDILKNKGIMPKRKKEFRNPRVRHRNKYKKALSKRKSQIPDIRRNDKPYEGEPTGIRTRLKRSVKLD